MKDIFRYSPNVTHKKHNLYIHTQNTAKFGNKNLRALSANIWNTLIENIKSTSFKRGQDQIANAVYANENETFSQT